MIPFGRRQAKLIGGERSTQDPRFATASARRQHRAELEKIVKAWASGKKLARRSGTGCASWIISAHRFCSIGEVIGGSTYQRAARVY